MKKLIGVVNIIFISAAINAQQPIFANNPFPKKITVSGSAEMEIIPDEIYVNVQLKEYQKKGQEKKDIETIKKQFFESSKAIGIPDSVVSIVSFTGDNPFFWKKRKKDPDLFTSITYQVKLKTSELMDKLVEKLDDEATQNFLIVLVNHSKMPEYRRQLKIAAVKAAKDKGIYLTNAIGETLGAAITINEPNENHVIRRELYAATQSANVVAKGSQQGFSNVPYSDDQNAIDFKKMKLRFEVEVVFALK
jgi:uncharacterized protein YggE